MSLDFGECCRKAERWAEKENFDIVSRSESERRMDFRHTTQTDVTFFIKCPGGDSSEASDKWTIWSDRDEIISAIAEIIDFVSSCRERCVEEILDYTGKKLKPLLGSDENCDDSSGVESDGEDWMAGDYYEGEDDLPATNAVSAEEEEPDKKFFTGEGSAQAVHRLYKDLKELEKSAGKFGVTGKPRGDNLFIWDVELTEFDKNSLLGKDLQSYAKTYKRQPVISMELVFPRDYPMAPPFARVLRPRFKFLTGHITIGGSICMEMLSKSGWRPINDIESILVQIRSEVMSDPNARLDSNPDRAYDEQEAKQAFIRTVQRYGWDK